MSLAFAYSVQVAYDSAAPLPPTATYPIHPPSGTAFVNEDTASITLTITSITGPNKPTNASASFTGQLLWFHGGAPVEQPSNVSTSVSEGGQVLTVNINSNPADASHPTVIGFMTLLSCTATDGNGTVIILTPDPTIVYVQPPG